jgi:hypothetical protein
MNESTRDVPRAPPARALTLRSGAASVFVVALSGVVLTLAGVFDAGGGVNLIGSEALPIPVYLVLLPLMLSLAAVGGLAKARVLTRAELFVVLLSATVAAPLMGMGFFRFQLAGLATVVRTADFIKFEALPEGLWPHGENLFSGAVTSENGARAVASGGASSRLTPNGAVLSNPSAGGRSALRLRVELGAELESNHGRAAVAVPGRPYLFTALIRAEQLAPAATHFVRVYADDSEKFALEIASGRQEKKVSSLRPDGFVRIGAYALPLPREAKGHVVFELGLEGAGKAEWRDLRLYDVRAIEAAFRGYSRVSEAEFRALDLAERQTAIAVPDAWFSKAGLRYLLGLDYPLSDWVAPLLRLSVFVFLILGVTFGLALLYRKQWLENERYPLPMARIPLILLGAADSVGGLGERFLKHRFVWLGFAIGLPWCALKVARGYYPNLPDLSFSVGLKGYFTDPNFGRAWDTVEFKIYVTFFALALLMELNVLLSLVVGFFFFRIQYWFGEVQGLTTDQDYPYFGHQLLGAYLAYGALVVFFTRRYLGEALLTAIGRGPAQPTDLAARRTGLVLVVLGIAGFSAWGSWLGMPQSGVLLLASHVLVLGFVGAKLRAECGLPYGGFNHAQGGPGSYSVPLEALLFVPILGGMPALGGTSVMVMTLVAVTILPFAFFNLPGLQVEFLEVGKRLGVRTRDVGLSLLLGFVLALGIGAFLYFFALYGFGASRLPGVSDFTERIGGFRMFNAEVASSEAALEAAARGAAVANEGGKTGSYYALAFGGAATSVITLLRQTFPGFWFHPIGFLVGASEMTRELWGSLLAAYLVRLSVLRLGGAATVREKLIPAAVGLFLAALVGHAVFIAVNAVYFFYNLGVVKFSGLL